MRTIKTASRQNFVSKAQHPKTKSNAFLTNPKGKLSAENSPQENLPTPKKNYIRLKGGEKIPADRRNEINAFNEWTSKHYNVLKSALIKTRAHFDDDVFHATLLKMYEGIAFKNLDTKCLKSYFFSAYKMNLLAKRKEAAKRSGIEEIKEEATDNATTLEDIQKFVAENFSPEWKQIFEAYLECGTLRKLCTRKGWDFYHVRNVIETIKKQLYDEYCID